MNRDVRLAAYAPADGGVNDHCIVRAADGWHYFFIYRRYDLWDGVWRMPASTRTGSSAWESSARKIFPCSELAALKRLCPYLR